MLFVRGGGGFNAVSAEVTGGLALWKTTDTRQ